MHQLDQVTFIPCFIPPHKNTLDMAAPEDRLEMTILACKDNPLFQVSDMEIAEKGPSYTVNTLNSLKHAQDCETFFILGTDSLKEIHMWKDCEQLFRLSNFIAVTRPGTGFEAAWETVPLAIRREFHHSGDVLVHSSSHRVIPSPVRGLDISSTRIRTLLGQGQSVRYLVPEAVRSHILENRLYGN